MMTDEEFKKILQAKLEETKKEIVEELLSKIQFKFFNNDPTQAQRDAALYHQIKHSNIPIDRINK